MPELFNTPNEVVAAFMIVLFLGLALLNSPTQKSIDPTKDERKKISDAVDDIAHGIANSSTISELDFWVNEINCLRNRYGHFEGVRFSCQRLYASVFNRARNMKLKSVQL